MFYYADIAPFILRLAIFLLIFSNYPLYHYVTQTGLVRLIFGDRQVGRMTELLIGWAIIFVNLQFALFYPNIGSLLSYVGAFCGFFIIYLLPVMVYIAQSKEQVDLELRG